MLNTGKSAICAAMQRKCRLRVISGRALQRRCRPLFAMPQPAQPTDAPQQIALSGISACETDLMACALLGGNVTALVESIAVT
jgi:hypothetical protein